MISGPMVLVANIDTGVASVGAKLLMVCHGMVTRLHAIHPYDAFSALPLFVGKASEVGLRRHADAQG